jgi:plasmid stabilization system protein ParE
VPPMTDAFRVRYTDAAREDLLRLFDHLLDLAQTVEDFDDAQHTIDALKVSIELQLGKSPFIYRKAGQSPFLRELIVSTRRTGYVALYEIEAAGLVNIVAVRHQREDDFH